MNRGAIEKRFGYLESPLNSAYVTFLTNFSFRENCIFAFLQFQNDNAILSVNNNDKDIKTGISQRIEELLRNGLDI